MNDNNQKSYFIPSNVSGEINIPFVNIRVNLRKFSEGAILGTIIGIVAYIFSAGLSSGVRIGTVLGYALVAVAGGCMGINGDPLSVFLKNYLLFLQHRDTMMYNPRIKAAADYSDEEIASLVQKNNDAAVQTFMSVNKSANSDSDFDPMENVVFVDESEIIDIVFEEYEPDLLKNRRKKNGKKKETEESKAVKNKKV